MPLTRFLPVWFFLTLALGAAESAPTSGSGVKPPPPPPPAAADDSGEFVADPLQASGMKAYPWTENQRRTFDHWFLPGAAVLDKGDWYYRVSHVARNAIDDSWRSNLLGLDDNVKIGLELAYAPTKATTVSLQRVNGRNLQGLAPSGSDTIAYDTYELLGRFQILDQRGARGFRPGPLDLTAIVGVSTMLRNHGKSESGLDLGLIAERDLIDDRLRLGVGVVRAGISAYDSAAGIGPSDKLFDDEYDGLYPTGSSTVQRPDAGTTSIPITVRVAVTEKWFVLAEAIYPIAGYNTGHGPSLAAGFSYNTNTHEFSFIFANTANLSFNSVITGGAKEDNLPFFAFAIASYL